MFLLYRKWIGILIALGSIALGLILFLGILGAWGREMNALSALYPVLMLIVGSSDVIHIFSKYTDELKSGKNRQVAMNVTLKEIGVATLLTSLTTAIGFATLMTSELETIREFGLNAAIGVIVAYITVLLFTTSLLSYFDVEDIIVTTSSNKKWDRLLSWINHVCFQQQKKIWLAFAGAIAFFIVGMLLVKTNYSIVNNLPRGYKVTEDFLYFEKNFGGFRPMEYAISSKLPQYRADDYKIVHETNKLEEYLHSTGNIKTSISLATIYKSFNQMNGGNQSSAYKFPENKERFEQFRNYTNMLNQEQQSILVSKDGKKTRISARITDLGADSIKHFTNQTNQWIIKNLDTSLVEIKHTGTGLILDKNSEYVRDNLLQGLGLSILMISILMGILFRSFKMLIIALIPNVVPLLMAAGVMGYLGIDMEAGISIIFTVIFGIAVDDTIHFLTRYKLCRDAGMKNEEAIKVTIMESGKAIIITSIVLFFGFLNMIFSVSPPTYHIGLLISTTLIGTLLCDVFLLPLLLSKAYKDTSNKLIY
jgi:predicted RND superfamily exporter protein